MRIVLTPCIWCGRWIGDQADRPRYNLERHTRACQALWYLPWWRVTEEGERTHEAESEGDVVDAPGEDMPQM